MKIKGKQLEDTLRSESSPFDIVYADRTVGDLNGAIRFTALNNTGSTISAYSVVYINGVSGNTPTIALADADSASMPAFGITTSQVTTGNEVDVVTFGNVKGVDTSLLSVGDVLYVSTTAGQYTTTPPTGSSAKLQNIGMVVKSDSNGIIKVGGAGRSAATPNLDEGKFFIGNASNQSSQSAYTLPTTDGSSNQVLATDGNGNLDWTEVLTPGDAIDLDDNVKVRLGTGNDFELFHDGTNSIIKDNAASGGSTIKYLAGTQTFQNKDANKTMALLNAAGSVDLYHNGVKKFETTSTGIQTTGTVSLNGAYTFPTADGSSGQVLTTDGSGALTFANASGGGSSITTQRVTSTSSTITAQKDYRYVIDSNSLSNAIPVTLPASPSIGDTIRFLPRYNNRMTFSSAGSETITRSGFSTEPYTEVMSLNEGVEIKVVYSGTEWIIESPTQEVYNWTSNTTINETVFLRYDTILLAYGTSTYTLPDQSKIPDGSSLEIIFTTLNATATTSSSHTLTFNGYNGNNEVSLIGVNGYASPTSSVTLPLPRSLKIYKYNSQFLILSDTLQGLNTFDKNKFTYNTKTTSTSINANKNYHYLLESNSTNDINVTLPSISTLGIGDEILFSRASTYLPTKVILSLDTTDAADANVRINAYGFAEINSGGVNSVALPLSSGIIHVKKVYESGSTQWYDVHLLQSGEGPTKTITATTETLSFGFNYLIDTATAAGDVTLTLPSNDYEIVNHKINIKVLDDTHDVNIKTHHGTAYIDGEYNFSTPIVLKAGNSKNRSISIVPTDRFTYKVFSDTGAAPYIGQEITANTTLSAPAYKVLEEIYTINSSSAVTVTLPSAATVSKGFKYQLKRLGTGAVTIDPDGTEYIDHSGQTTFSIGAQYDSITLISDGSNWLLI